MIFRSCLRAAARSQKPAPRFLSTTARLSTATATPISTSTPSGRAPTSQGSATAQPLSDPLTPSAKKDGAAAPAKEAKSQPLVKSSVPAGTPLKGLNFLKNKSDPIAMEDSEYPAWLWQILQKQEKKAESGAAGDLFSKSKKQRRLAAKRLRKEQLANPDLLVPKVPIYEQTIDLPAGDGTLEGAVKAAEAREELTKALRNKRRAAIKEANFLKAMG